MPSYYEALPIYRAALDCAVRVDAAVLRFSKGHKYTLGARLRDTTADVLQFEPLPVDARGAMKEDDR